MAMRFVILEHTVNGEVHFDLMMEVDGEEQLRTLQLQNWPPPSRFVEIAPHRKVYLDYEGDVSDGRGVVRRVMSGEWLDADNEAMLGVFQPVKSEAFTLKCDVDSIVIHT
ncbi:MAG: hypothetical protein ACYTDT_00490 [Planctomycetota bacterium]|jgi:hypothetical protein